MGLPYLVKAESTGVLAHKVKDIWLTTAQSSYVWDPFWATRALRPNGYHRHETELRDGKAAMREV